MPALERCLALVAVALLSRLAVCSAQQMTAAERQEAIDFHNHLRRNTVPRAADMNALFWQDSLAELAQKAADRCVFEHNYDGEYAGLGENLYKGGRRNMTEILMMMFLERELYNYTSNKCTTGFGTNYPMFPTCGHYFQLVTASLSYVGCGIANCDGFNLVACEYDRSYTSPPYQAGEPGTKCSHTAAFWYQNGLCYRKVSWAPQPTGSVECKIECMNGGTLLPDKCLCMCPAGYSGNRCETYFDPKSDPGDCADRLVECENGGKPKMTSDGECRCRCRRGFRGQRCQVNAAQADNSVFWYFGQQMRYASYYPVNETIWTTSPTIQNCVQMYLVDSLNKFCRTHYKTCCPEAGSDASDADFVNYDGYAVTDFYPAGAIDGTLKVGTYLKMLDSRRAKCNSGISPLVNQAAVLRAAEAAIASIRNSTARVGVKTVRFDGQPDL